MLLLRVRTGSRLTGFSLPSSDWDWLEVHDKVRTKVRLDKQAGTDVTVWDLRTFTKVLYECGHNALEVCFAPDDMFEVDHLTSFRHSFRANPYLVEEVYGRTIRGSSRSLQGQPIKHAIFTERLTYDIEQCYANAGRYDPTQFRRTARGEELYSLRQAAEGVCFPENYSNNTGFEIEHP